MKAAVLRNRRTLLGLAVGGVLAVLVFSGHDFGSAISAVELVGGGLILVVGWRFVSLALVALAWRMLFAPADRPPPFVLLLARWAGEAVNTLLPVAQIGGDLIRARLVLRAGAARGILPLLATIASIIADMTLNLAGQAALALLGAAYLWSTAAGDPLQVTAACVVALLPVLLMMFAQKPAFLDRVHGKFGRWFEATGDGPTDALGASVAAIYARRGALLGSGALHLTGALSRAAEVWIVFRLMDSPIGFADAIMIEGLSAALRTAAFLLPAGLGIQEGALLVLCGWVGIPPSQALALALIKRGREIVIGLGGLAVWLAQERPQPRIS